MQNKIVKFQSEIAPRNEIKLGVYESGDRSEWSGSKCWRVDISYSHHVWLDEVEKDYFVQELAKGKKIIRIGSMILTNRFLAITKVV